jgi:hypothetical protein
MLIGSFKDCTIADEGTVSGAVDLGRPYETLLIVVPAIDSATLAVQGSETLGGTYTNLYVTNPADGSNKQVKSGATTGGLTWVAPIGGFQFIKLVAGSAQTTAAVIFRICGVRR